ncbi:hypothetical protein [Rhodoferax antarcticus]|uniref:Integral membrane transport domain protein n=2 Tax=Rhodoferax antarcticus TaxID=81479 RepID=A0A1Q8YIP6_9BURK|nr:hypothetical protein [Rhodoferax antarcticus]MCW2313263.1 putative PurR-regulated permease PerM [Rhodoferax antarcticus]OLP07770.1 integral membrane transport domain protein [Rhodoferax antarcticus ANT.BR]
MVILLFLMLQPWRELRDRLLRLMGGDPTKLVSNNVVEPMLYGDRTGVSSLAVLLSAVFWAALWGWHSRCSAFTSAPEVPRHRLRRAS